jgi:glycosyltransferase involved in cell wall biosynthesis
VRVADPPSVSVVVPTYQRPDLVVRAVRSALDQTIADVEVVVVVDGRDPATIAALSALADPRLVVHVPDRHLGNSDARNEGVARTRARWVAFLDDDDEWLPAKLERQLAVAERACCAHPIVTCRLVARSEAGDKTWPRRLPRPGEDWSEYFFCRRTPFTGEGMITTSTLLTSRALLDAVPFSRGLTRHVDPDWILRAVRWPGTCVEFVPDPAPLVVWHAEVERARISTRRDWTASFAWCRANRHLFSERGYAAFLLHVVGSSAGSQRHWRAFPLLLREAFAQGQPAPIDLASYLANFSVPGALQRRVAAWYARVVS